MQIIYSFYMCIMDVTHYKQETGGELYDPLDRISSIRHSESYMELLTYFYVRVLQTAYYHMLCQFRPRLLISKIDTKKLRGII
jgi:hypothetical protein